jgi:lipopolysaccharide export system protein LptA
MALQVEAGQPRVTLSGAPATIGDKLSRLSGPLVVYEPGSKHASVRGPGTLHAMQESAHGTAPRPITAQWTEGVEVDGNKGRIELTGQVLTTSTDAEGAKQTARGQRLTLLLAPSKTTTQPASRPLAKVATTRPASPAGLFAGQDNFLANQTVETALFEGDAKLESVWAGPGGELLRRLYLTAPSVRYSIAQQRLLVPAAGKMLVEDHRKPPAAPDNREAAAQQPAAARGTTAFQWNKQLTFDQMRHEATMKGDVVIVHEPQAGTSERGFQMQAQQVTAELAPAEAASTQPATTPATHPDEPRVQLKRLTAEGRVHVQSGTNQIDAQAIAFDPETGILTAKGTEAAPVQLSGAAAGSHGSFVTLEYDLKNDRVVSMTGAQFRGNP